MKNQNLLPLGLTLALSIFIGCTGEAEQELREPGAEGPVLIKIWDLESGETTEAEATAIDFIGKNYNEVRMYDPRLRMPILNGLVYIQTAEAVLEQGKNQHIVINEIIHLSGEVDGKPLVGTAQSLNFDQKNRSCYLSDADFIWGKKHVTVRVLHLKSGHTLSGEDWRERPVNTEPRPAEAAVTSDDKEKPIKPVE